VVNVHTHVQQQMAAPPVVIANNSNGGAHAVHAVMTVLTCGLWAPVWIIHAIVMASNKPQPLYPVAPPMMPRPPMAPPGMPPGVPMDQNQMALAMVAQHNGRRAEARRLAAADPMSAKQLGIGRRDLPGRGYDDGGLIDINRVPAEVFTQFAGVTAERAAHIVTIRESLGGAFSSVEELMAMSELPPHLCEEIMQYAVVIR
jgi:hypothetical protein